MTTTVRVLTNEPIGTISPRLYGHFAEHLGRCCYGGLWVGHGQGVEGFHPAVIEALRKLPVPMLRWPGGCYADHYHWRDGIGDPASRPSRLGMSCGLQVEDDNGLGTHEFLALCRLLGAEPYLAGNVGSGTPQELCDWVEYCNATARTTLARERAANGAAEPYGVRLWGVGNENWGCGGNYDPDTYAREYRRYATMLRHVDPQAELVACGYDDAWNVQLVETLGDKLRLVDHLSIHDYWFDGGPEVDFDDDGYSRLLATARGTEAFVARTAAMLAEATGRSGATFRPNAADRSRHKQTIGVALDEYGVWHPEARPVNPYGIPFRTPVTYEQANTLRDGLAISLALAGFHRQCNVLSMANLAQIVNVLQAPVMTDGDRIWLTPTYHALAMHAAHIGATALPAEVTAGDSLPDSTPALSATASTTDRGLTISLVNQHRTQGCEVSIAAGVTAGAATAQILSADAPNAQNNLDAPDRVAPKTLTVMTDGSDGWRLEMPPHSLVTVIVMSP